MEKTNRLGQEEMVGFAMIVIIVSIILVFFLIFSVSSKPQTTSSEAESFLKSSLQYTTTCSNGIKQLSVQDLISSCYNNQNCSDGNMSCSVLSDTWNGILETSWPVGEDFPTKGYKLDITSGETEILSIEKGNITGTYKGAQQGLPHGELVIFNSYS